ncbi:MAG: class I SAM-dependent methyltransferase, partial [Patescibacteria group bacterium]
MKELEATYDKIAEDWSKDHNGDSWWVEGTEHLVSLLPHGASILDVGCGTGHKTKYFFEKGLAVVGADFSEGMLAVAKREVPGARFMKLDLYDIDQAPDRYDCVFAQAVFLHI